MGMSFFSLFKKNIESYSLVFNIGSGSVSGGIIKFTSKPGVDIIYYVKENIPFQQEISITKHLELMQTTLQSVAGKLQSEGLKKIKNNKGKTFPIDRAFYIFSSPWSASETRVIRINEPRAFKVTEAYLNKVITEQEKQFQADVSKSGHIIEKKIIQIKMNGYIISDINNKHVKEAELSVFFTVVPEEILQVVENAVSKIFTIKNHWCHSMSLTCFSCIRDIFHQNENFIHMDISEEMTDISIINNSALVSNASIPLGRNHFIRELSRIQNVSEDIADSMIKMYCLKNTDAAAGLKLGVIMDQVSALWLAKVSEVLDNLAKKIFIPNSIFLISNNDLNCFMKEKLLKKDYKIIPVYSKNVRADQPINDGIFKLELMFLDNQYKI